MIQIEFRFLICSYLPGIPLSLALYIILQHFFPFITTLNNFFIWYIILLPLVVGLCLDAIRHWYEFAWQWWHEPTSEELKKGVSYGDSGLLHILTRSANHYHVYEFFCNLGISLVITTGLLHFIWYSHLSITDQLGASGLKLWHTLMPLVGTAFCILFAWIFKFEQDRVLDTYFRSRCGGRRTHRARVTTVTSHGTS